MRKLLSFILILAVILGSASSLYAAPDDLKEFNPEMTGIIQSVVKFNAYEWLTEEWRAVLAVSMVADTFLADSAMMNQFKLSDLPDNGYVVKVTDNGQDAVALFMWTKAKTLFVTYNPNTVRCKYTVFPALSKSELESELVSANYWKLDKKAVDEAVYYLNSVVPKY